MKAFFKNSATLALALVLAVAALIAITFTPEAKSAFRVLQALPVAWADDTGSNSFALNASAAPVMTYGGVVYTSATTNIQYVHGVTGSGTGATNTLVFINGILYQRQ